MAAIWVPTVRPRIDGQDVRAATDNQSISDLTNRTDWLKQQLDNLEAGQQLLLRSQTVQSGMVAGEVVYLDKTDDTFKPALAAVNVQNLSTAADSTFWQGVIQTVSGTVADIVLGGAMELTTVAWAAAYEDGTFAEGDVFLSAVVPGKLTTDIGTAGIYLGHMRASGELLVRLGNPGAFIDHVHYGRTLLGQPADSAPSDPAVPGDPQVINTPDDSLRGWLPANSTYFPGFVSGVQIPTDAVFGYNIQHPDESALREIFPLVPPENSQFSQSGLILEDTRVLTNAYGIWWLDPTAPSVGQADYGQAPWPVDYVASGNLAPDILLWTTRLIASAEVIDLVLDAVLQDLSSGTIDTLAVSSILATDPLTLVVAGTEGDGTNGWQGAVTITPNGCNVARYKRGLLVTGTSGNNTTGFRGIIDLEFVADLEAKHLWTEITNVPLDTYALVSTNGFTAGADIGLRGHRLGPDSTDFIDFLLVGGRDLIAATDYQPTIVIHAAVDTPSGAAVTGQVEVSFYRLSVGQPLSSIRLQRTEQVNFTQGVPGRMQRATVGPFADVILQQGERILVRISPSTGGSPLTADSLRVLGIFYGLTEA